MNVLQINNVIYFKTHTHTHIWLPGDQAEDGVGARNGKSEEDGDGEEKSQTEEAKSHAFGNGISA